MIRLAADEDFNNDIVRALRRTLPDVNILGVRERASRVPSVTSCRWSVDATLARSNMFAMRSTVATSVSGDAARESSASAAVLARANASGFVPMPTAVSRRYAPME